MPTFETIVRECLVTDVFIVIHPLECFWAKPTSFLAIHMFERLWRIQHLGIGVEDVFEVLIDLRNTKEESSLICIEKIHDDTEKRNACNIDIRKFRRSNSC